jgi:RNA polymerase sigma-70 factor (ECF subfamily)
VSDTPAAGALAGDITTHRTLLFSIAYRMLGTVAEAEDIVQEAFLRYHRACQQGAVVDSPKAWLAAVVTRLAIDHLRSARIRRESYVGQWLPEPVVADQPEAEHRLEMAGSLSMAFLVLLETLSPVERAVFLLREVFDHDYSEIASIVDKSEDNCRQIFTRAKRHIDARKPRFEPSPEKRDELAGRFFAACREGSLDELIHLLAADAVFYGDGGGKAAAVMQPVIGRDRVARLVFGIFTKGKLIVKRVTPVEVNGQPGAMAFDSEDRIISVFSLDIADGAIHAIRSVINPEKLRHLGPVSDLAVLPVKPR